MKRSVRRRALGGKLQKLDVRDYETCFTITSDQAKELAYDLIQMLSANDSLKIRIVVQEEKLYIVDK